MHRLLYAALCVVFLFAAAPAADAQSVRQMRQEVEASMLVTGHVDIDYDGRVTASELDHRDKLPPYVINLIEASVPSLRFEPIVVDGAPVLARAQMSARLVMAPGTGDEMHLRIASAHFGELQANDNTGAPRSVRIAPPRFPSEVARVGGQGDVYLLVKVGRDGRTEDVHAEQVNLTALGSARQMARIRQELTKAAVNQARRHWEWAPPTTGPDVDRDYWVVRVPVTFRYTDQSETTYGQWAAYHPGEMSHPQWAAPVQPGFRPDALVADQSATPETSRFKLLTPFGG